MLKSYFKIACRSLVKDKQFTFLNILGLTAGLTCSLLIFLWVNDELHVDKLFDNDHRLYQLFEQRGTGDAISFTDESSGKLSEAVKQRYPDVEYAAAVAPAAWFPQNTLSANEKNIKANGQYAEKDFFDIFSYKLLVGHKVLANKMSIVLSDELATKLFGTISGIVGKRVQFDHDTTFYVSGVFEKMPASSSQQFDFVLSFDYFRTVKDWVTGWNNLGPHNYVLLKEGVDIDAFNQKVANIVMVNTGATDRKVVAKRFSDGYLYQYNSGRAGRRIEFVNLFTALAVFILLIACINFMNLSTAKAARRLKEVGIKKVVGARRGQLIFQFLLESFVLTVLAMGLAIGLAAVILPQFNQLTGKEMVLQFNGQLISMILMIVLVTGFLAGSYPALYISRFKPLAILKGKLNTSLAELLSRKGLVVFQFALSGILIVAVLVIYRQVQFIRDTNVGYHKENIVRFRAEGGLLKNQAAFLADLQQVAGVTNASNTWHNIIGHSYSDAGMEWPGKEPEGDVYFEVFGVGTNFIETMGMQVMSGRSFSKDYGMDSMAIVLNEAAAQAMGLKNPVGTMVQFHGEARQIIGVVKNFHFESMHEMIKPSFMHLAKGEGTIVVRIQQEHQQRTLAAIEGLYKKYSPGFPFTYNFLDEAYQKLYKSESLTATLSGYFAGLAIIISCLGLFGLAAFMAQKRQKEIGIRKVIGASAANVTALLSRDFLMLVGIALVVAFPVAWWMMTSWLESYAYRIHITWTMFLLAGGMVMVITVVAIGLQTVRAAVGNPVKALRAE